MVEDGRPHIVLVVARGEAVRNFIFSDTLRILSQNARVTLISLVEHGDVMAKAQPYVERIVPLRDYRQNSLVAFFHEVMNTAHYRWMWTEAVKYYWGRHNARVKGDLWETSKLIASRIIAFFFANRPMLRLGTQIDRWLNWQFRPTRDFDVLFREIQPDLVFNCSHIHGPQADLPLRVAHALGIKTASFLFSWDNLTSRSRILVPYDHYLVWTDGIKAEFMGLYPEVDPARIHVTGTPQFDFHFDQRFHLTREELCKRVGLDPARPFILYTTGMDPDFAEEHRTVRAVIDFLKKTNLNPRPQLLVRTYIKGNSPEMLALGEEMRDDPDVIFPPILWDKQWLLPLEEDLYIYTNLLRHCALGINGASTVTLELMMMDKPVVNLGFEPPDSHLPYFMRFSRHINYEHYRPVSSSGGVMIARSVEDLQKMILRSLEHPGELREARQRFIREMFGNSLDGNSGRRVADCLIEISKGKNGG